MALFEEKQERSSQDCRFCKGKKRSFPKVWPGGIHFYTCAATARGKTRLAWVRSSVVVPRLSIRRSHSVVTQPWGGGARLQLKKDVLAGLWLMGPAPAA